MLLLGVNLPDAILLNQGVIKDYLSCSATIAKGVGKCTGACCVVDI